jgi:hypothetical protein
MELFARLFVSADVVNSFQNRLDKHWLSRDRCGSRAFNANFRDPGRLPYFYNN